MAESNSYGRNRESLADLVEQLEEIFKLQPTVKKKPNGQLILPVSSIREVLKILFEQADLPQLTEEDEAAIELVTSTNPDIELSPANLLEFVAQLTANIPNKERRLGAIPRKASPTNQAYVLGGRGRGHDRNHSSDSRSSSSDSLDDRRFDDGDEPHHYSRRVPPSPFDARARQRTAVVEPPSSWSSKRPAPASRRRRSDAGSNYGGSDNESAYGYSSGRRRTSNPVSPSTSYQESNMPGRRSFDQGYGSRPHSRSHNHNRSHSSLGNGHSSSHRSESPDAMLVGYSPSKEINTIPIPTDGEPQDEEAQEGEEVDPDLIPDPRLSLISFTSSIGDSAEQTEALRKALADMTRRSVEQEKALQEQLAARELDIEDIQAQLENTRDMISTLKRDEKEWRSKERHYVNQVNSLETDVNRLQRTLDQARSQHHTLQKQHAEQLAEIEKYRSQLRNRDIDVRDLEHRVATYEHEANKAKDDQSLMEEQVKQLQAELSKAQLVHGEFLGQKQENALLKETIDRLRYDLDDLRSAHANDSTKGGSSAPGSAMPSLSRTLGSELLRRMDSTNEEREDDSDNDTTIEETVEENPEATDDSEDVFQTIITRKRKIVGKGKKAQDAKMVDASTQCDLEEDQKPVISTQIKVEPASPSSRLLQLPRDDPPSYQLSEIEQSGGESLEILRKWHGVKVLGPLPGGISREAVEDWHALKRELGVKCPIIEEIIEQSGKQTKQGMSFGFSPMRGESARRYVEGGKRRFYNIYNTYILGGEESSRAASASREVIMVGKWAVAIGAWSAFLLWYGSSDGGRLVPPGSPSYTDRALWSSFNALAGAPGEGFGATGVAPPVDAVGAVWFVVGKLVRGATDIATRRISLPS